MQPSKLNAITMLLHEARAEKGSTTAAKRVMKAARTLSLSDDEIRRLDGVFDYCDYEHWQTIQR